MAGIGRWLSRLARRILPALAIFVAARRRLALASDAAAGSARFESLLRRVPRRFALALLVLFVVIAQRIARLLGEPRRSSPGAR